MATDPLTPEALTTFLSDPRFTTHITLPADPASGRDKPFSLTYADYGYRNEAHPEEENVLLFFGPLLGSRLLHVGKDALAKKHKVRVINPDRPGFGRTDDVPADKRLRVWRGVMMDLLHHLNIKHVSLSCQSAGTVYLLDILFHHPEILHPTRPYAALGSPWMLPTHSGVKIMTLVKSLPSGLVAQADKLASFVNNSLLPVMGSSLGYSQLLFSSLTGSKAPPESIDDESTRLEAAIFPRIIDKAYAETVHGLSQESLMLLQNAQGDWGDYDVLGPRLSEILRNAGRRLVLDVYFAETDGMIGDAGSKGPLWFEGVWKSEVAGGVIDYTSSVVAGSDHDMVWTMKWGAVQKVFEKIGSSPNGTSGGEA